MKVGFLKVLGFMASLAATFSMSPAFAGHDSGGGGDAYSQEFAKNGWIIYEQLAKGLKIDGVNIDLDRFKAALEHTEVNYTKDDVTYNGFEKCARYYSETNQIIFGEKCISDLSDFKRREISVHEYLRASGAEDGNYQISARIAIAIEGDPVGRMESQLSLIAVRAEVALLALEGSLAGGRNQVCYNLGLIDNARQNAFEVYNSDLVKFDKPAGQNLRMAFSRLLMWEGMGFCSGHQGKIYGFKIYKPTDHNLRITLLLMKRDAESALADLAEQNGRKPQKTDWEIWNEYGQKLSKLGSFK